MTGLVLISVLKWLAFYWWDQRCFLLGPLLSSGADSTVWVIDVCRQTVFKSLILQFLSDSHETWHT